jgi:hypothetical protein
LLQRAFDADENLGEDTKRFIDRRGRLDRADAGRLRRSPRAWIERSGITEGPVFRSVTRDGRMGAAAMTAASIALIVKRAVVAAARADRVTKAQAEIMAESCAGHSPRAGHATSAAHNDAPGHAIQRQLRDMR